MPIVEPGTFDLVANEKKSPFYCRLRIDLVVVGAVAVDLSGRRIGKGEGFADLEFALAAGGFVHGGGALSADNTLVCCTVHDCQV